MSIDHVTMPHPPTPAQAWNELAAGNERFATGGPHYPNHHTLRRTRLAAGQAPFAAVFGCSDSRVPPELLFDRGLGDLFVVRTAGHTIDPTPLGSLEYAVEHLDTPLIVVVGHEACGAVGAALSCAAGGDLPGGYVCSIVERITPSVDAARRAGSCSPADVVAEHVRATVRGLTEASPLLARRVADGDLAIVGLAYGLTEGRVTLIDRAGDLEGQAEVA